MSKQSNQSDVLPHLVLIPTEFERQLAGTAMDNLLKKSVEVQICGIGLIETAIRTLQLVHARRPRQVWLVGIAGSYIDELIVGNAYEFSEVCCYGIGVGAAEHYQSIEELGWSASLGNSMLERISLSTHAATARSLLSTTAASANLQEVTQKLLKFPDCQAEDMEAFSVARACQSLNVPLRIIRGISNIAGDREHKRWKAMDAMRSAVALVCHQIEEADDHKN